MNTKCLLIAAVAGTSVLTAWGPSAALGQCEITRVTAGDRIEEQKFGWSTAISGDYAVVGTDEPASATGVVYIYERDGLSWNEIGKLVPGPSLANDDEYGRAVAISGRVAVVGARKHSVGGRSKRGAVYVFRRNLQTGIWAYEQELSASDGDVGDLFGGAVAIDGDWIVVGAADKDEFGRDNTGTAYVFHFDGSIWTEAVRFRSDEPTAGDRFGNAVAISGNWVIVGTKQDDDTCPNGVDATNSGSVSTFFHNPAAAPNSGWDERTKLQAQVVDGAAASCDAAFSDSFGHSVAISGDRLVVGAINDDDVGIDSGSAYVYRLEELDWVIEQKLTASDGAASNTFGRSVAIRGDLVLVSAAKGDLDDPAPIADTGSAYLYRRSGTEWIDEEELTASDAAGGDRFGQSVSIGGDYAIIGAYAQEDKGAAYILAIGLMSDCNENGVHDDCEILAEPSLDADGTGILDSCECKTDEDCDGALDCISGTCNVAMSLCVFTVDAGFCAIAGECPVDGARNPDNDCELCDPATSDSDWSNVDAGSPCDDPSESICDHPDTCDGEGLCRTNPELAGTECDDDGNECTDDLCDGSGVCGHPDKPDLTACTSDGNECTDNLCQSGQCSVFFLSNLNTCGDLFDSECDRADTCDGNGNCDDNVEADGTDCFHDGLWCTGDDSCQGGVCETGDDRCTEEGLICNALAESRQICSCLEEVLGACDDGEFCNGEEICDGGVCFPPGSPCDFGEFCDEDVDLCVECLNTADCIEDGNDCTVKDCRDGVCEHDNKPDDTPCGGDLGAVDDDCTNPDTCAGGLCLRNDESAGTTCGDMEVDPICDPQDSCDGNGTCLSNIPPNFTLCADDEDFCSGLESCIDGVCKSEGNPCTAEGLTCDDISKIRNECSCDSAVQGACDDGNECTIDECVAGACTHEAVPDLPVMECTPDGEFCNGVEICNAGECLSPGDPCETGEDCSEDNNICRCDSNDDCAEDGLYCNGEEICSSGVCISEGDPCLSKDKEETPVCIEATNSCECTSDNDESHCDNGEYCDGAETCVNGACQDGPEPCTADESCNEQTNVCEECETGDDDACDDGESCTTDRCPFGKCRHETLPECMDDDKDGVSNAEDQCPDTTEDAQVDAIGCTCADAIDTDHDGVIDCDDQCNNTPLNEPADSSGCSCSQLTDDSDGDCVANESDECPGTPSGETVDETGCGQSQIDSDGDGVMDDEDDCPGTPAGIPVGDDGCPLPVDNGNDNDNTGDNENDNGSGQPVPNDNENDNDNGNDNDNTGDNGNDNTGGGSAPRPCGLFGMITPLFLGLGMVAMRMTRRRHRRSRR